MTGAPPTSAEMMVRNPMSIFFIDTCRQNDWNDPNDPNDSNDPNDLAKLQRIVLRRVQRLSTAEHPRDVSADDVEAVADHAARQAVSCQRHVAERLPAVARRVVRLERARHGVIQRGDALAAGDVDAVVEDAGDTL